MNTVERMTQPAHSRTAIVIWTTIVVLALAVGGAKGIGEGTASTMKLVADNVQTAIIPGSGHWVAEEAPEQLLAAITPFLAPYQTGSTKVGTSLR